MGSVWHCHIMTNVARQRYPVNVPQVLPTDFQNGSFALRPDLFELHAILRQVHRLWPQMTLNTKRSKAPHTFSITHKTQRSVRSTVSRFETSEPNDPNLSKLTLQGQRYPSCILQVPPNPKFQYFLLHSQFFCFICHFKTSTPNGPKVTPKMTLNTLR